MKLAVPPPFRLVDWHGARLAVLALALAETVVHGHANFVDLVPFIRLYINTQQDRQGFESGQVCTTVW